jgi:hypothetical protein
MRTNILSFIILIAFFTLLSFAYAQENTFFILFDICKNDTILIKEYGVQKIETPLYEESKGGNYSITFISTKEEVILKYGFDVMFLIHGIEVDPITGEVKAREVKVDCVELYFRFPFFDNIKKIRYMHSNKIIYEKEICNFNVVCERSKGETELNCLEDCGAKPVCGNKVCESPQENQTNCCLDCGCLSNYNCIDNKCVEKPICGNKICETNLGENSNNCPKDCLPPKPKTPIYVYIIIILVIFVIIALFLYKIRIVKVKQANF